MKNKAGATCETCKDICKCYCASLCKTPVEEKFISKKITITPPIYCKDPTRLIPRIVHQTWFEEVTKEKYPNMSRLIESWKRSGWEYRFYSDSDAAEYLSLHFPPEVREAYDSILPGAFKADLFRYCALLIDGGVYADMDVLLEANLDAAVPGDVGFMTPVDEPGLASGHRMCLWNGLIASAPGHPFLARVIENVVNNARNRFTSVDTDNTLCPNPELSVSHSFDMLFTAGPCMLGRSINDLLRRHPQTSYEPGTINIWGIGEDAFGADPTDLRHAIPGRSIILKQDKYDMGAHRFTWEEENLVIAATDMPDYDDRDKLEDKVHYSDTQVKFGVYGLEKLYTDNVKADEKILMSVSQATGTSSSLAQQ